MTAKKFTFLICELYRSEFEEVIRFQNWQDVQIETYPKICCTSQKKYHQIEADLQKIEQSKDKVICNCARKFTGVFSSDYRSSPHFFHLFVNPSVFTQAEKEGEFIFTPNWLNLWSEHLAEWGLDQSKAKKAFNEKFRGLLLLDTGISDQAANNLLNFSAYIDLPAKCLSVGLDYLRLFMSEIVCKWRHENELAEIISLQTQTNQRAADQAMVIDLLTKMTETYSEEEVFNAITDIFTMLFSSGKAVFFPLIDGALADLERHSLTPRERKEMQTLLSMKGEPYLQFPDKDGFYLRIEHHNTNFGILLVENVAFPKYISRYLHLSTIIAKQCGLAIANAQNFKHMKAAETAAHREAEKSEKLRQILNEITSDLDQDIIINHILISLHRLIPLSRAGIYLRENDTFVFNSGVEVNSSGELSEAKAPLKTIKINPEWMDQPFLTTENFQHIFDSEFYPSSPLFKSRIGVILKSRREMIGLLLISHEKEKFFFSGIY